MRIPVGKDDVHTQFVRDVVQGEIHEEHPVNGLIKRAMAFVFNALQRDHCISYKSK